MLPLSNFIAAIPASATQMHRWCANKSLGVAQTTYPHKSCKSCVTAQRIIGYITATGKPYSCSKIRSFDLRPHLLQLLPSSAGIFCWNPPEERGRYRFGDMGAECWPGAFLRRKPGAARPRKAKRRKASIHRPPTR